MKAIDIIHGEHRALGAVLQALRIVLDGIGDGSLRPDFELLAAMIDYITEVPDKLHHPKEDEVLFVKLRERLREAAPLINKLEADHARGIVRTRELREALDRYRDGGAYASFDAAARKYMDESWRHLEVEETELLPLARRSLAAADWDDIDAAFAANKDPWSGSIGEYRSLFSRIVNLVPAPYGLGDAFRTA